MQGSKDFVFKEKFNPHGGRNMKCKCQFMSGIKGVTRVEGYDKDKVKKDWQTVREVRIALGVDEYETKDILEKLGMPSIKHPLIASVAIKQWKALKALSAEGWLFDSVPLEEFLSYNRRNFGHEASGHCHEWGLDKTLEKDREALKAIISSIIKDADAVKYGNWRGQESDVIFFIKGDDVVVTKFDGEFVSILKGGVNNERVKTARSAL